MEGGAVDLSCVRLDFDAINMRGPFAVRDDRTTEMKNVVATRADGMSRSFGTAAGGDEHGHNTVREDHGRSVTRGPSRAPGEVLRRRADTTGKTLGCPMRAVERSARRPRSPVEDMYCELKVVGHGDGSREDLLS